MKKIILPFLLILFFIIDLSAQQLDLIPKPVQLKQNSGVFHISNPALLILDHQLQSSADYIDSEFLRITGIKPKIKIGSSFQKNSVSLLIDDQLNVPMEGYELSVTKKGVFIKSPSSNGLLNGFQTLLQACSAKQTKKGTIPMLTIKDYPRFEWRGMMLDVSRQFFDKETVKNYIDWLAAHKMNVFHWHLTDDNGWRIEIKSMPDLTSKGAWRGPGEVLPPAYGSGNERYGGFYSQEDIMDVVAYASQRGISIMPELEVPGHSRAVIGAYPEIGCVTTYETKSVQGEVNNVWCVGREENYEILDRMVGQFAELFPFEYIHIAGDEVNRATWEQCPECQNLMKKEGYTDTFQLQNYFFRRLEKIVAKYDKKAAGWNEILKGGALDPSTQIFAWQGISYGIESAKKGHPTIMIPGQYTYLDMAQSENERGHRWAAIIDTERVYSFEPIQENNLTLEERKHIKGVQGALWSEYLDRPERFMEYQSYPRIAALSEVAWSQKDDRNWDDFYKRLTTSHLQRLSDMGIAFRDFPPLAAYKNGIITVTLPYDNAVVRYDSQGKDPVISSPIYTDPITTDAYETFRFRTFFGNDAASPTVKAEKPPVAKWNTSGMGQLKLSEDISDAIDKNGIYYLTFADETDGINPMQIEAISLYENGQLLESYSEKHALNANRRFRFPITNHTNKTTYRLEIELLNNKSQRSEGMVKLELYPYLEPQVKVTSSMEENSKFPLADLEDFNEQTYFRSKNPGESGDWILYTFTEPIVSSSIDVLTGIPKPPRFFINDGYVSLSYNGEDFEQPEEFSYGNATLYPKKAVKAVKIMITGTNHEPLVAAQDLRINP